MYLSIAVHCLFCLALYWTVTITTTRGASEQTVSFVVNSFLTDICNWFNHISLTISQRCQNNEILNTFLESTSKMHQIEYKQTYLWSNGSWDIDISVNNAQLMVRRAWRSKWEQNRCICWRMAIIGTSLSLQESDAITAKCNLPWSENGNKNMVKYNGLYLNPRSRKLPRI